MKDAAAISGAQQTDELSQQEIRGRPTVSYREVALEEARAKTVGKKEQSGNEQSSKGQAMCDIYGNREKIYKIA